MMSKVSFAFVVLMTSWTIRPSSSHLLTAESNLSGEKTFKRHHPMRSLQRKRRNSVVSTQELVVNKQVQVFQGLTNPDTFRVSVTGNTVIPNISLYDLALTEDTTGLEITAFNNPSDQNLLDVQTNSITYSLDALTETETLEFSYDATLRNFGAEVASIHNISTLLQYQLVPPGALTNPEMLNIIVCIQKSIYTIASCSWCWSILIIVVCFIAGILLAFLLLLACLCLPSFLSFGIPNLRKKEPDELSSSKKGSSKRPNIDVTNVTEILTYMDNERQMLNSVEILELRQLVNLERTTNDERISLTKELTQALLLSEQKHDELDDGKMIHYPIEQLSTKENLPKRKLASEKSNPTKRKNAQKREEEIEAWKEKLNGFSLQEKQELMLLVEQRHVYDVIDDEFIESLNDLLQSLAEVSPDDANLEDCLKHFEKNSEFSDVFYKIVQGENFVLSLICDIFSENVRRISDLAKRRQELVEKYNEDCRIEKRVWEKITSQQLEMIRKIERRDQISSEEGQELKEKVILWMRNLREKYEEDIKRVKFENLKSFHTAVVRSQHTERLRDDDVIEDADDVQRLVRSRANSLARRFQDQFEIEIENDRNADKLYECLKSAMTRYSKLALKEKDKLKDALLLLGVDELWIDNMLQSQREELERYCDEMDDVKTTSSNLASCDVTVSNDASFQLLRLIDACQLMASQSASLSLIQSETLLRKNALNRLTNQRINERSRDYTRAMKEKRNLMSDVIEGDDVIGIRRELQEKLSYAMEGNLKKTKKSQLRDKRHHSMTSYKDMKMALSNQLRHHYSKKIEQSSLTRERQTMEELTMTLLELMTTSGQLTSRGCKLILEEFRSEADETKRKYVIERKRREEALRRKTKRALMKKQNPLLHCSSHDQKSDSSLAALLHVADDVIASSSTRINDERAAVQELFCIKQDVFNDQERALLTQELVLIRKLSDAMGVDFEETKSVVDVLLPGKPASDIRKLCHVICPKEKRQKKGVKTGSLLEAIDRKKRPVDVMPYDNRARISSRQSHRSRKLSPLGGAAQHNIGLRPEPLGRASSSEIIDRYDVRNLS